MKILHVVTGLGKASGVTTFVENVVREQRALGYDVDVFTVSSEGHLSFPADAQVFHIHGLWSPLLHRASGFARQNHIPVVWSTHGMTAPWSMRHKRWKKRLAWHLYQRRDLRNASLIHCTTEMEAEWNRRLGLENVCVIPLGTSERSVVDRSAADGKVLLFVGRIYPVKALDNLIRAFATATGGDRHPDWMLRIVGPDQAGHLGKLEELVAALGLRDELRVQFVGPKFGNELSVEYENSDALALVSHTENFGATVVDAMAHGKPVITSTNTPWRIVVERHCGWWVSNGVETLAKTLDELFSMSDAERAEMGERGRALVKEQYEWGSVVRRLESECLRLRVES